MYPSFFVAVRHAYYREGSLETKQSPEIAKWGAYYREGSLEI